MIKNDNLDGIPLDAACAIGAAGPYKNNPAFHNAGCGVFISENEVATCWHVLLTTERKQLPKPLLLVKNQNGQYARVKKLIVDPQNDLAYMVLSDPIGHAYVPAIESPRNFDLTDKFQLLSNYKGKPAIDNGLLKTIFTKSAKLKAAEKGGKFDIYLTEQDIQKGYSGSAIIVNGKVCSALSAKSLETQGEVWAPSTVAFAKFIEKARKEAFKPPSEKKGLFGFLKKYSPLP